MTTDDIDRKMMRRALQLAAAGRGAVAPNPMVGAVITAPDGRIIGQGWHRRFGGPHAEVNAVASVAEADRDLLRQSTIYVTLEPCSHYGKTPPCARLLAECRFARVVVGAGDPNPKVAGRGIAILKDAGIEVTEGVLADQCRSQNREFMFAHTHHRPWVTLKWAQSSNGFLDGTFSTPLTRQIVHWRRAHSCAIAVGANTVIADNPSLNTRHIEGNSPQPVILDRHNLLRDSHACIMANRHTIHVTDKRDIPALLAWLYADRGYTSLLVEGGAGVLDSFIASGMWNEAFVELSPLKINGKVSAPSIAIPPSGHSGNIYHYINPIF